MAILGLSEFTFGFGFLYEQTAQNWGNLRVAPVLPSLAQEADDAWDARLPLVGTDFYYQFKLSDYLVRSNSVFHKDGTYNAPYYRLAFHRRDNNRQHHRLWLHGQKNPDTFYVAPEFESINDFNSAFLGHQLALHSRMIRISDCDDCNDGDQHYITFQQGSRNWIQHSKPKRKTRSYQGQEIRKLYTESQRRWRKIDENFAESTLIKVKQSVNRMLNEGEDEGADRKDSETGQTFFEDQIAPRTTGAMLRRAAEILSVFVGATMVLVGEGER